MRTQGMFHCHIQHIILPLQKSIICIHLLRSLTTSSTPSATGRHRPPPAAMPRAKTTWRKPSRSFLMALAAKALRRRDWKSRLQPWPRSETTRSGHPQWVEVLGIPKKKQWLHNGIRSVVRLHFRSHLRNPGARMLICTSRIWSFGNPKGLEKPGTGRRPQVGLR